MSNLFEMKWWGWGDPDTRFDLRSRPAILRYMQRQFGVASLQPQRQFNPDDIKLPRSRLSEAQEAEFVACLGNDGLSKSHHHRLLHSFGKSYKDLIRLRAGQIDTPPDAVVFPASPQHLEDIFRLAAQHQIALVPFGGGTSVVSGIESQANGFALCMSVDMRRLNKIIDIDVHSLMVTTEAGIFGRQLEQALSAQGLTLGHFPQSFEFSTVGGWLAARGSGQNSSRYGAADKMVLGLKALSPAGPLQSKPAPQKSCGPDFKQLMLGSEGIYGIIHQASLRLRRKPAEQNYFAVLFKSFAQATETARKIAQADIDTAMIRVSDEAETESLMVMSQEKTGLAKWGAALGKCLVRWRGFQPPNLSMMMIGLEGAGDEVNFARGQLRRLLADYDCFNLGCGPGKSWLSSRYFMPYLRDEFLDNGMLVDTLETATTWSQLMPLYKQVCTAMSDVCVRQSVRYAVYGHISHVYGSGASLYFTVIATQASADLTAQLQQWQEIKDAASQAIGQAGGVISHHHGVGVDHRPYLGAGVGEVALMRSIKQHFDPNGLLNPGKLLPDSDDPGDP